MICWTVLAAALVAVLLLPENRYDWMREMDPSIPAGAIEDGADSHVPAGLAVVMGVGAAAAIAWASPGCRRWMALTAGLVIALLWAVKFSG